MLTCLCTFTAFFNIVLKKLSLCIFNQKIRIKLLFENEEKTLSLHVSDLEYYFTLPISFRKSRVFSRILENKSRLALSLAFKILILMFLNIHSCVFSNAMTLLFYLFKGVIIKYFWSKRWKLFLFSRTKITIKNLLPDIFQEYKVKSVMMNLWLIIPGFWLVKMLESLQNCWPTWHCPALW